MIKRIKSGLQHGFRAVERHPFRAISLDMLLGAKVVANCNLLNKTYNISCDTSGLRGILPDPIDIISHSGNNTMSAIAAFTTACLASAITGRLMSPGEGKEYARNYAAIVTGTLAAVAVKVISNLLRRIQPIRSIWCTVWAQKCSLQA